MFPAQSGQAKVTAVIASHFHPEPSKNFRELSPNLRRTLDKNRILIGLRRLCIGGTIAKGTRAGASRLFLR